MRWWLRLVVTLIVAPLLWRLATAYIGSEQGGTWSDLARQSVDLLTSVYIAFTLPALVLCGILLASDRLLHKLGIDLLTVLVSPLLAGLIATAILHWLNDPRIQSADGAIILAIIYGLTWGLTIREPLPAGRGRRSAAASGGRLPRPGPTRA